MASLLGFLGALGDASGVFGTSQQQPGALTRFNNAVDPVAANGRAQAQTSQNAITDFNNDPGIAAARASGTLSPQAILNFMATRDPQYAQQAAQIQAQNPLSGILNTNAQGAPVPYNPAVSGPKDPNAPASLPWSTQYKPQTSGPVSIGGLVGDDLIKALPPSIGNQVKAIAEGRQAAPSSFAMKSGYGQQLMALVSQYDPSFDITNPAKRLQTAKSFAPGGKDRQNINSIETAINTLAKLQDASDKLGGVNDLGPATGLANSARTAYLGASNDTDLKTYETLAKTAADETTKAVVGGQGGGVGDRAKREEAFHSGQSPAARSAAIQASINELSARLDPVAASYTEGLGKPVSSGIALMTPKAQKAYAKIMGTAPDNTQAASTEPATIDTAPSDPVAVAKAHGYSDAEIQAYLKKKGGK